MFTWESEHIFVFASAGELSGLRMTVTDENLEAKDAQGNSPLMLAAFNGHYDSVQFLLQLSADPDTSGNTALIAAAFAGHIEIVRLLLRWGADPFLTNKNDQSANDVAEMLGRKDVMECFETSVIKI
jgi:ankyrin repeat protein